MMKRILFKHAHLVVDGIKEYLDGALLVNNETIEDVFVNANQIKKDLTEYEEIDLKGLIIMPSFFDSHNHYVEDEMLAKKGTTSYLSSVNSFINKENKYARNLGIHFEGSFENLKELLTLTNDVKQVTVAPELENSDKIIEELRKRNIKVMFGNSSAINDDVNKYHDGYTHLFVNSSGLLIKDMGLANLAFEDERYVEFIASDRYINESIIKLILKNIRKDKLILVSNSSRDNKLYLSDEIKLIKKFKTSLSDILLMTSLNAYKFYGLDKHFGSLIKGKYADIVILDEELNVISTYIKGELIHA